MHRTQITNALTPLLSGATSFALFDFPNHCNVGDSLIWLGLRNYLRDTVDADRKLSHFFG